MKVKILVNLFVTRANSVLFVRYQNMPDGQSGWLFPGDALEAFEPLDKAVRKIAREQLGISAADWNIWHAESFKGRDGSWHVALHFCASLPEEARIATPPWIDAHDWIQADEMAGKGPFAHAGWCRALMERFVGHIQQRRDRMS
jgi:ADP-ribose pyrophosphatase YjhB (NUDIX family)